MLAGSEVGLCVDTGHLAVGGADPVALTARHPDRVAHVHLKDVDAASPSRSSTASSPSATPCGRASSARSGRATSTSRRWCARSRLPATRAGTSSSRTSCSTARLTDEGPVANVRQSLDFLLGTCSARATAFEVLTMGRVGVDIYPDQIGVRLEDVTSFGKYLGGSPTNVAVAAARHGRRVGGDHAHRRDPFGRFVHQALRGFGVDDRYVSACRRTADAGHVLRDLPARRLPALLLPAAQGARPGDQRRRARPRRDRGCRHLLGHRHRASRGAVPQRHHGGAGGTRRARHSPSSTSTTGRCSGRRATRHTAHPRGGRPRRRRGRQPRGVRGGDR